MPNQRTQAGVFRRAVRSYFDDDMLTHAAALAYKLVFALFPFIIVLVSLLGFLNLDPLFTWFGQQAKLLLPDPALHLVNRVIDEIRQRQGGILSFSIFVALWSASSGVRSLMNALNDAYDVEEGRPVWKRFLLSILFTIGLFVMFVLAASFMLIGPEILQQIAAPLGLTPQVITLWLWLRWPLALLLLMLAVSTAYAIFPATKQPFQLLSPGAVFAVIIWVAASYAFSFYVQHIGNYSATYGSLGAVVMLIFYFYLSAAVLLFGAEINAARRAPAALAEHDTDQAIGSVLPLRERAVGKDAEGGQSR